MIYSMITDRVRGVCMKLVTAIIRSISLEKVVKALKETGVKGMTICVHNKIEIIVTEKEVGKVAETILNLAQTREPGDGVITVQKIEDLIKIRTGECSIHL